MSQSSVTPRTAPPRLHFRIPPEPSHLLRARERLRDYLRQYCTQRRVIDDMVLCVEEACANAIRHGGSPEDIEIALRFTRNRLVATVKDRGRGFDVAGFDPEHNPDPSADHGRGLFIIARLMDDLELRLDGGLEVRMACRAEPRCDPASPDGDLGERVAEGLGHGGARTRAMLEEIDEGFIALDWEYRYEHLNGAALDLIGKPPEELLGRTPWEVFPELRTAQLREFFRQAMELGRPSVSEHRSIFTDTWNEVRIYPTITGLSAYFNDITERKRGEEALLASEERFRLLHDTMLQGVVYQDNDGAIISMNPAAERILGKRPEDFLGSSSVGEEHDTLREDGSPFPGLEHPAMVALRTGKPVSDVLMQVYNPRESRYRLINIQAVPLYRPEEDEPYRVYTVFDDVTDRRQAQADQRESEERFRSLFESTTEGIALHEVVYDDGGRAVDYRVIDVNPSFESQTGLPAQDARGRLASELYGTDEAPYLAEYARVAEGGEPYAFETYFPPLKRHFRITATCPRRGRFATVFEDITERKRSEEALRASEEAATAAEAQMRRLLDESRTQAEELAERVDLAEALNSVNRLVHSTVDFDEIMQHALGEGVRALGGDAGTIEMREGSCWAVRYQVGFSVEDVGVCLSEQDAPSATRVMASREPLAIADMRPDRTTNVGFVRAHRLRSVLAVPLIVKESVIGCLLVYGRQVHRFDEAEVDFGRTLSATLSLAIENARLYEAQVEAQRLAQRELETTAVLLEAATAATSWTDLDRMLESLGDLLLRCTDHSRVLLELWDEERREIEIAVSRGAQATARQRFKFDDISDGAKDVITTRKTVVIDYARTGLPASQKGYVDEHAFLLMLVVPVVYRERLVGLITVDQPGETRPFSAQEIQLVEAIAGQAATAIENARLYAEAVERERLSAALNQIAASIATLLDYDDVLTAVVGQTGEALGAESSAICSLRASELVPTHLWRLPAESLGVPIPRERTPYVDVAVTDRRVVAVDDCETDPRVDLELQHEWGVRSVMAAPLVTRGEAAGVMFFNYHSAPHTFAPVEIEFVDRAAALISGVLESAGLYEVLQSQSEKLQAQSEELQAQNEELQVQSEELQSQGEELQAQAEEMQVQNDELLVQRRLADSELRNADLLLKSAKLLAGGLDLETVVDNLAIVVLEALPHSRVTVQLWDAASRTLTIAASHGHLPAERGTTIASEQTSPAFRDMLARKCTIVTDFDALPAEARGRADEFASRFHLAVPLVVGAELFGVLVVDDPGERRPFAEREIVLLEAIAAQAGTAVENARVFEAQRHIAQTLQENFIHELPTVPGLELGVVTKTAYEPELVGGDFSDVFVLDEAHVVVLIGDVAGKGVRAAGLTETVRSKMRAFASIDPSPAFILAKTNELLLRFDPDDPHVTAFCAVLDPRSGRLSYASAGHPAPVHVGALGCRPLQVAFGPPLGSFERPYTNAHAELTLEDYLVLYTDGVIEARRGNELLGEQRLIDIVCDQRGRSAQEVADGVRGAVLDFAGRLHDDLQVVVVRRRVNDSAVDQPA